MWRLLLDFLVFELIEMEREDFVDDIVGNIVVVVDNDVEVETNIGIVGTEVAGLSNDNVVVVAVVDVKMKDLRFHEWIGIRRYQLHCMNECNHC